jgi:signal transduction histidine kinase
MNIDPVRVHRLKNKLAIILGFSELLLSDLADDDPRRADVLQILEAGREALAELPPLPAHELDGAIGGATETNHGN